MKIRWEAFLKKRGNFWRQDIAPYFPSFGGSVEKRPFKESLGPVLPDPLAADTRSDGGSRPPTG
jgi:hypothetical protein